MLRSDSHQALCLGSAAADRLQASCRPLRHPLTPTTTPPSSSSQRCRNKVARQDSHEWTSQPHRQSPTAMALLHRAATQSHGGLLCMGHPAAGGPMEGMASVNLLSSCPTPYLSPPPLQPYHPWCLRAFRSHEANIFSFFGREGALDIQCRILALYTPVYLSKLQVPLDKTILWDFSAVPPCAWACHTELTAPKC